MISMIIGVVILLIALSVVSYHMDIYDDPGIS